MTHPFDMDRAVTVACDTMAELAALLEAESQALEEHRFEAAKDALERKERLTRNLDVLLSGLRDDKARFAEYASANPTARERLEDHWNRLAAGTARNADILKRHLDLTQSVVDVIVEEARRTHQEQTRYGSLYGRAGRSTGSGKASALSVSLNTTL